MVKDSLTIADVTHSLEVTHQAYFLREFRGVNDTGVSSSSRHNRISFRICTLLGFTV